MQHAALLLLAAFVLCGTAVHAQDTVGYRLPKDVRPSNYKLTVTPYLTAVAGKEQFTFDGIVEITLNTTVATVSEIVLHSLNLNFTTAPVLRELVTGTVLPITVSGPDATTDKLTIRLTSGALSTTINYVLRFVYVGPLNSDMRGFYRSSYREGETIKWAATTQMQATHARRVFPSFDEPEFKATFDVIVNRPVAFKPTISNTAVIRTETINGLVQETFRTTPPMSTYLLAFIVSEFQVRENADKTMGVIARPAAYSQTEYALAIGQQLLEALNKWTAYEYTSVEGITKMHMAALPDFSAGAMENWGLLTYRETALLYDPSESTDLAQQRVASVITHEQAHMWFGDLVTCEWWSYTWLNEGFARFFQYFGTDLVLPAWDLEQQFVIEQVQAALNYDSVETSRALTADVWSPAQVSGAFDSISYNKGASVLRMVQHLIGKENFQTAIREYLKANQFGTSTPLKLFQALQKYSGGVIISTFLEAWTTHAGYPVVTAVRNGPLNITLTQERFFLKERVATNTQTWHVPLSYATSRDSNSFASTASQVTLSEKSQSVTVNEDHDWVIFNVQQTGYYRVNYDEATWKNISTALKASNHSNIHVLNRAQIVDDLLNLARNEYVNYTLALDTIQYLEKETAYAPWLTALNNLAFVARRLSDDDLAEYKKFIVNMTQHAFDTLTFEAKTTDKRVDVYNRANILSQRCKFGEQVCVDAAKAQFLNLQTNATYKVPVNVRSVVYCTAIAEGNQTTWDLFWDRFTKANVAAEQVLILTALGCTKNKDTLTGYLNNILGENVRLQDKQSAFVATYNEQPENVQVVLDYVIAEHAKIASSFGSTGSVTSFLSGLAARFTKPAQIEQLKTFRANTPAYATALNGAIADAEYNQQWSAKHLPVIVKYIRDHNSAGGLQAAIVLVVLSALLSIFH